jgi:hypothetical protein
MHAEPSVFCRTTGERRHRQSGQTGDDRDDHQQSD